MNEYQSLLDAHRILARLYSHAWAQPTEVPTPIALSLLHAREHVGEQLRRYLSLPLETEIAGVLSLDKLAEALSIDSLAA